MGIIYDEKKFDDLLDFNKGFRENIFSKFKEAFVRYYGESERENIDKKFNSTYFFTFLKEEYVKKIINEIKGYFDKKFSKKFLDEYNLQEYEDYLFSKGFLNSSMNEYNNIYNLFMLSNEERKERYCNDRFEILSKRLGIDLSFEEFKEIVGNGKIIPRFERNPFKNIILKFADISSLETSKLEDLKNICCVLDENITEENFSIESIKSKKVKDFFSRFEEMKKVYNSSIEKYSKFSEGLEYNKELFDIRNKEYYEECSNLISSMLPNHFEKKDSNIKNFVGNILDKYFLIKYFSKEDDDALNNPNLSEAHKNTIKNKRIEYFKLIGIDYGDNYEEYLKNSEYWPSYDCVKKIIELNNKYRKEYCDSSYFAKETMKEMQEMGFIKEYPNNSPSIFDFDGSMGGVCYFDFVLNDENKLRIIPQVFIPVDVGSEDVLDKLIIHELNHLYETTYVRDQNDEVYDVSGWDIHSINHYGKFEDENLKFSDYPYFRNMGECEYSEINERINELITIEISNLMRSEGIEGVSDFLSKEEYLKKSGYGSSIYLVEDFFELYKDEIKESRKNANFELIFNAVGKENFEALNNLIKEHSDNFYNIDIFNILKSDLNNNKDTKLTRKYYELVKRRDEILQNMEKQYKKYKKDVQLRPSANDFISRVTEDRVFETSKNVNIEDIMQNGHIKESE